MNVIHTDLHFLHVLAILFVISIGFMYITGKVWPTQNKYDGTKDLHVVDTTPWNKAVVISVAVVLCAFGIYVLFSRLGIAA